MTHIQQTFGQFETPPDVADLLLALCLRGAGDRVLDPSCGTGALLGRVARWQRWLADGQGQAVGALWGVELEAAAAAAARERLPQGQILHQNFFTVQPDAPFDAVVGNPPYTRAEWIDRLEEEAGRQMAMFETTPAQKRRRKNSLIPSLLWNKGLNRRAGLHTYFLLHGARFLREGGRFGFVMPNNWLDVDYGESLKQFLLDQFKIVALIESAVERWFDEASVNTCLVILEKCSEMGERAAHQVRFVQLRRPLRDLLGYAPDHPARFSQAEVLGARILPGQDHTGPLARVRVTPQSALRAGEKWGLYWRAPAVYRQVQRQAGQHKVAPLRQWATVQRGFTTGANAFFYLDEATVNTWQIEPEYRRPLLKSLRNVDSLRPTPEVCAQQVLTIPPTAQLQGTAAAEYVAWGQSEGYAQRRTCRQRQPWYVLPLQQPGALLLPKGIWGRHLAPQPQQPVLVDQQLYRLLLQPGVNPAAAGALLNSAWLALQLELQGRVNFGEGVLWMASYEIENLLLPDPRYLAPEQTEQLASAFETVAARPIDPDLETELTRPDRQALDAIVFDLLGLSATEGVVVIDTLLERVRARMEQARSVRGRVEIGD